MSQSGYGNESNKMVEEVNVVPSLGAVQLSQGSGSSSQMDTNENQLVLYNPNGHDTEEGVNPIPIQSQPPLTRKKSISVEALAVQCSTCLKWRIVPLVQIYEEIREHLVAHPFFCDMASEWKPNMSCDVPEDIPRGVDGTQCNIWAMDKHSIPCPPTGWSRLIMFRPKDSSRFGDVYYFAPSGKKLRSSVEIQKYLNEHPEYITEGLKLSQFSFQLPTPLQDNYVRKRSTRPTPSRDITDTTVTTQDNPDDTPSKTRRTSELQ